jgi:hypothetical protein
MMDTLKTIALITVVVFVVLLATGVLVIHPAG